MEVWMFRCLDVWSKRLEKCLCCTFLKFPKPPEAVSQSAEGRPKAVRPERRHMKLASMWRRTRSNRAKRASAVFLLRRGSALPISHSPKLPEAAGRPPQRGDYPRNTVKVSRGACANSERKHSVYWDWSAADSRYALTLESNESNSSPSHLDCATSILSNGSR